MSAKSGFLPFRKAAVLGAGVMGAQIAAHLANAGLEVLLLDIPAPKGTRNAFAAGALKMMGKMKPAPFASKKAASRIAIGNLEDDLHRIGEAEWVIEVVKENLDIKKALMAKVQANCHPDAIISTNTSGLPIAEIAGDCDPQFRRRFLGTHFFNPPRYLKLLEIIPTPDTDPHIVAQIQWFGRVHLGKSIVIAKDTPNFIANRIGTYAMMQAFRYFTEKGYTVEEVDALTGPVVGNAKSATFRTADVVGLDTLLYVAENLYHAIPGDESRDGQLAPPLLKKMVENGLLGAKVKAGFYKKVGKDILSLNPESLQHEAPQAMNLGDFDSIKKIPNMAERLQALYNAPGRPGDFTREYLLDLMGYCVRRIPEIADRPVEIDRALCWGFAREVGPFQIWDMLGYQRVLGDMRKAGMTIPAWLEEMDGAGHHAFYEKRASGWAVYHPGKGYVADEAFADQPTVAGFKADADRVVHQRAEGKLIDIGDDVLLFEFGSKANTLSRDVVEGIIEAVQMVENGPWKGLVIGNDGRNFTVGANLGEAAMVLKEGGFDKLEAMTRKFQEMVQTVRYARKPVVAAIQGMALGGGCELSMACSNVVAALESYIGLTELGVGLIPAGTGSMHLAWKAAELAANPFPSEIQPFLIKFFESMATARVSTSAVEAIEMGYLDPDAVVVMNADRRIYVAREEVLRLANRGFVPRSRRNSIMILGQPAKAVMESAAYQMMQGHFASPYDRHLASQLAWVMCGGDITGPTEVNEDYLLDLEVQVFVDLLKERKTQERVESILLHNKPLRN